MSPPISGLVRVLVRLIIAPRSHAHPATIFSDFFSTSKTHDMDLLLIGASVPIYRHPCTSRTDFRAPNTILGLELCAGVVCVCVCFPRRVPSVIINLLLSPLASQQPVVIVRAHVREIDASISLVCRYRCEWFHRKSRNTRA